MIMVKTAQAKASIDIQDLKGRLSEAGKKIALLRGYL